jgi:hypothetical protein
MGVACGGKNVDAIISNRVVIGGAFERLLLPFFNIKPHFITLLIFYIILFLLFE